MIFCETYIPKNYYDILCYPSKKIHNYFISSSPPPLQPSLSTPLAINQPTKKKISPQKKMRHLARSLLPHLQTHLSTPSFLLLPTPFSTTTTTTLSSSELSSLRHLLPSLISSGHPLAAIRLLDTALLTNPPLSSLPLPLLADRLSSLPSISPSLSLLTALRFNPLRPSPLPFCSLLISSYFRRQRPREAAKIFAWLCRPDSPCRPDAEIYGIAVRGFCERGRAVEAVRVAREMARDGVLLTEEIRVWVCLVLLGEARVREGLDFDDAAGKGGVVEVREVLDRMIRDWEE